MKTINVADKKIEQLEKQLAVNTRNINRIHNDVEKRLRDVLYKQAKIIDSVSEIKSYKSRMHQLEENVERFEKALVYKDKISGTELKKIHNEITNEFERINSIFVKTIEGMKNEIDTLDNGLKLIQDGVANVKNIENNIKEFDIKTLRRDMEILKTKHDWMETKIDSNVIPLEQKITTLEKKIRVMKNTTPILID